MSWQAMAWAMKKGKDYELDSVTRFVLLTLSNYADPEGNDIYPSLGTLEADTALSERTIRRHIKTLIAVGLLDYGNQDAAKGIRGDQRPKVYRFVFEGKGGPDLTDVGSFKPKATSKRAARTPKRTESPVVKPVDKPAAGPVDNTERPDSDDGTTGQTTGHRVHQSFNPKDEPTPPPVEDDELAAGRRLREQARARLEARGPLHTRLSEIGRMP